MWEIVLAGIAGQNLLFSQHLDVVFVTAASVHPRLFHTEHTEINLYLFASRNLQNPHDVLQGYFQKGLNQQTLQEE